MSRLTAQVTMAAVATQAPTRQANQAKAARPGGCFSGRSHRPAPAAASSMITGKWK